MTTQQLLDAIQEKHSTIRSSYKWTYRSHFERLRSKHITGGILTDDDLEFLYHIYHTDYNLLREHAYINGQWYDYAPKNIKVYNIPRKRQVKFAQLGKY